MLLELNVDHIKLLEVLPQMYQELIDYPESLTQMEKPGIPSLSFAWLDPMDKDSSSYGVDVSAGLKDALKTRSI